MPSHQNVWWGKVLAVFQLSFWVKNQFMPASRAI